MHENLRSILRPKPIALILVLCIGLAVLLERLIVTDAERIQRILTKARRYSLDGEWDKAVDLLDPDYAFEGRTREDLRAMVQKVLQGKPLSHFQYLRRDVEVQEGGWAVAKVRVFLRAPPGTGWDDRMGGDFEIGFKKREDRGWVVRYIRWLP
ncbi:MAG: hypothetical protein ACYTHM_05115 [Planctomycetota bacterium]|jgi:hypothetical protein